MVGLRVPSRTPPFVSCCFHVDRAYHAAAARRLAESKKSGRLFRHQTGDFLDPGPCNRLRIAGQDGPHDLHFESRRACTPFIGVLPHIPHIPHIPRAVQS
ncbi:hypothetical protein EZV77_13670 [Burkholderia thailandensis]|nr:hypothetical protein [Burkholderia thailandensis]MDD1489459.1 hypothetical protein [Burkholderia thailandensis]MDD1495507.1 hypothetical protein [Burkholderia thailandensis]PJO70341.1 hypothetical protein CWD92_21925 [Burkholderia thailandensis]TBW62408.1 hypothetical protein EZV77_13670 [Burkholderia thailandensis]